MQKLRVYIVEDDKELQGTISTALSENGFDVRVFDDGYPVVALMDNWPDIFLIEIELPGINGIEVCKWLKSHDGSKHIPVIFISSDSYLKALAAPACADDYIEKPLSISELIRKIKSALAVEKVE